MQQGTGWRGIGIVLAAALVLAAAPVEAGHHERVIQVVVVKVEPGMLGAYRGQVKELMGVMKRIGSKAQVRMWQATIAGDNSGNMMVGVEYPDQDAWARDTAKLQADPEYQRILAGLGVMREVESVAMWREITKSASGEKPGPILAITGVRVQPGKLADYRERVDGTRAISDRLGLKGRVRLWHADWAGPQSGAVAVGIEYPDLATFSMEQGKLATDAEWQQMLKGLAEIRTLTNRSVFQEITP